MDTAITWVISKLLNYKYVAMFGILFMCGMGLPIPEEVTLVGSGLLVGWGDARFIPASIACVLGILAGDSIIFGLGYHYGPRFFKSRPMRFLLPPKRQLKVARFFGKHGLKAVFFARFFAGVRIGVYSYAGSQRMSWIKFLILDLLGALISGPTSVAIGWWCAHTIADNPEDAQDLALHLVREFGHWLVLGILVLLAVIVVVQIV